MTATELNLTSEDLIGSGSFMYLDCVPSHYGMGELNYIIKYHYLDIGLNEATVTYSISNRMGTTKYFNTLILSQPFILNDDHFMMPFAEDDEIFIEPQALYCSVLDTSVWYQNYDCRLPWSYSAEDGFPGNVGFNVSITEGQEYGDLFYFDLRGNKIQANSFSNLYYYDYSNLRFEANGIEPVDSVMVKVHIEPTESRIQGADSYITIFHYDGYPIKVTLIPDSLSPGDIAEISLEERIQHYPDFGPQDVVYEEFAPDQLFDVRIDKGIQYGTILNSFNSDTSYEFNSIPQGFKFIASKNINVDTAKISVRVHALVHSGGMPSSITKGKDSAAVQTSNVQKRTLLKKLNQQNEAQKVFQNKGDNKFVGSNLNPSHPVVKSYNNYGDEDIFGIGKARIINDKKLVAYFDKDTLHTGDTTTITIKLADRDGNEYSYPDTTHFEVGILKGCGLGLFLDSDSNKAEYFSSIKAPIKFVVSDSLNIDSTTSILFKFGAPTMLMNELQPLIRTKNAFNGKAVTSIRNNKLLYRGKEVRLIAGESTCTINEFYSELTNLVNKPVFGSLLKITKPTKDKNDYITEEPKMPTVVCEAHLEKYDKGQVNFEWEYCVSYKLKRRDTPKWVPLASRDAEIRFVGTSTANNTETTSWTVPFDKDHISYLQFKAQQPQRDPNYHPHYGGDDNQVITTWDDGFDVFIGGYTFVKVTAKDIYGNIIDSSSLKANKILGQNPDPNAVYSSSGSKEIEAILRHEARTKQFAEDKTNWSQQEKGWPIYGNPNGYGLMQLVNSPPPAEMQLWNWKKNLEGGGNKYFNLKGITKNWMQKMSGKKN